MTSQYDAIVVGAGATGTWAAKELAEAGMSVLLLEAGPPIDERVHFGPPPKGGSAEDVSYRLRRALAGQHIQARHPTFGRLMAHFYANDRLSPYTVPSDKPFLWIRGHQVGGRTHTWGRVAIRMSDLDFKAASRDGYGLDWPISYADLVPAYDRVETFLGLTGEINGIAHIPDGRYSAPNELNAYEARLRDVVETQFPGRRVVPLRQIPYQPSPRIPKPLVAALATGKVTLRPNALAARIDVDDAAGRATGVTFVDRVTKAREQATARYVFLCASAFESVRLLLNSKSSRYVNGVGNSHGLVGKYVMDHLYVNRFGSIGDPSFVASHPTGDAYDRARALGIYIPAWDNLGKPNGEFLRTYAIQGGLGRTGPFWFLAAFGEMLARPENTVRIHPRKTDAWGIPIAHIECAHGDNDAAMLKKMNDGLDEIVAAADLTVGAISGGDHGWLFRQLRKRIMARSGGYLPGMGIHEAGGARMGADPEHSVLDSHNRVWDAQNVYVTDASAFTSGGCQNNTLTIMALTVRAAHHAAST